MDLFEKLKELFLPEFREIRSEVREVSSRLSMVEKQLAELSDRFRDFQATLSALESGQERVVARLAEIKTELRFAERLARLEVEVELAKGERLKAKD